MSIHTPAIVLIHGGWHSGVTWNSVVPRIEAQGHRAVTLDLPGAGAHARTPPSYDQRPFDGLAFSSETSPVGAVTQAQRTAAVIELVEQTVAQTGGPVVLLGHSLGGLTITAVAEAIPEHLHSVVYLSAFMLPTGLAAIDLIRQPVMAEALVKACILADPHAVGAMRIDFRSDDVAYEAKLRACFAADVSEATFDSIRRKLSCDEPLSVFSAATVKTAAFYGHVARHFIRCLEDRAIPLAGQDFMIEAVDAEFDTATRVYDLPGSHSPFHAQPAALTRLLVSTASS